MEDPEISYYVWRVLNSPEFSAEERHKQMVLGNFFSVIGLGRELFVLPPDPPSPLQWDVRDSWPRRLWRWMRSRHGSELVA